MEKDLCLDVALRARENHRAAAAGRDVIYTRSDDSFIPLEERTNIANQAKADLFISIHANSSRDHAVRGIERTTEPEGSAERNKQIRLGLVRDVRPLFQWNKLSSERV